MKRLARVIAFLVIFLQTGLLCAQVKPPSDRAALINEIVNRSRLLEDAHFRVPRSVWRRFVIDEAKGPASAPVSHIVLRGDYSLKTDAKGDASIDVEIHLLVFDARRSGPIAVLSDSLVWSKITLGDDPFRPAAKGKWLVFQPPKPGSYVIRARGLVEGFKPAGGSFALPIARGVRTSVA